MVENSLEPSDNQSSLATSQTCALSGSQQDRVELQTLDPNITHQDWIGRDANVVWHGFTQMHHYKDNNPVIASRGAGRYIFDVDGNKYLDAISSLWVVTLGHALSELNKALFDQANRISHATMLGNGCDTTVRLAELLSELVPVNDPKFLFASDGASAVEQALKIAFQYWKNIDIEGHDKFIALKGAYHGDTVGAMSVSDSGFYGDIFNPLKFETIFCEDLYEMADYIRDCPDGLAGAIVEPLVQAASGIQLNDSLGLLSLSSACNQMSIPLIVDEIATGFGRTGSLFASQEAGIRPDIMCLGKAMTGGYLPMSATVVSARIANSFLGPDLSKRTLFHGHTFGGNALAAAVAIEHLKLFDSYNVLANVKERSIQLHDALETIARQRPVVKEVRTKGLFAGIELNCDEFGDPLLARKVCAKSIEYGVILRSIGSTVTTVPILTSSQDEIDRIAWTIGDAIDQIVNQG